MAFVAPGQYIPQGYVQQNPGYSQQGYMPYMQPMVAGHTPAHYPTAMLPTPTIKPHHMHPETPHNVLQFIGGEEELTDSDSVEDGSDEDENSEYDEDHMPTMAQMSHMQHPHNIQQYLQATAPQVVTSPHHKRSRSLPRAEAAPAFVLPPNNPYQSRFSKPLDRRHSIGHQKAHQPPLTPYHTYGQLPTASISNPAFAHIPRVNVQEHVPQPPVFPKKKDKLKRLNMKDIAAFLRPQASWAETAARMGIITSQENAPAELQLSSFLALGSAQHFLHFDAVRQPVSFVGGRPLKRKYLDQPATAPSVTKMYIWTAVNPGMLVIANDRGVTVGDVIEKTAVALFEKIKKPLWNSFDQEKQDQISTNFYRNREPGHAMPPIEKGLVCADLLGRQTIFTGLSQVQVNGYPAATFQMNWARL